MLPILVVSALVLLNGFFAMGEMALVSVKTPRLELLAEQGNAGAGRALALASHPQRFLPTAQIGMTLVSFLEGAFGAGDIEAELRRWLEGFAALKPWAHDLSVLIVVLLITFALLVFGELVPKQLALQRPETIAIRLSWSFMWISRLTQPVVWLLGVSSALVLRFFRRNALPRASVTEEELRAVLAEGAQAGVLEREERVIIERLLRLADQPVRAVMTPRNEIFWIDRNAPYPVLIQKLRESDYARIVVCDGDIDHPVGVILARDVMDVLLQGRRIAIKSILRTPPAIPDNLTAQGIIERLRGVSLGILFVLDEYGTFEGIITPSNLFEAVLGEEAAQPLPVFDAASRDGESCRILEGSLPPEEVALELGIREMPFSGRYHTLGGVLLALLKSVPSRGDSVMWDGWKFEVLKMEGRRIERVLATKAGSPAS